jgi:Tfp pilus assembly protein PilF
MAWRRGVCWLGLVLGLLGRVAAQEPPAGVDYPALIAKAKPAVVSVVSYDPSKAMPSTGTGFLLAPDRMVTCLHLLNGCNRAELRLFDGRYAQVTAILAMDRDWDLALCQLSPAASGLPVLSATRDLPAEGEPILVIGGPLGLEWTSSAGMISAVRPLPKLGLVLQHTAAISPGNSGGPVLNARGEVIGVQQAATTIENRLVQAGQGLNFAVPASHVLDLKPGPSITLAALARELPADWRAPVTAMLDKCSLRPFSRGDFEGALEYFQDAVKRDPEVADNWFRLGLCCEKTGDVDRAEKAYRKAVALDDSLAVASNNLGVLCLKSGRVDEAIDLLLRAAAKQPDLVIVYCNLVDCYQAQKRWSEALAACEKGLGYDSRHVALHYALGVTLVSLGRRDQAAEQVKILEGLDKGEAEKLRALVEKAQAAAG